MVAKRFWRLAAAVSVSALALSGCSAGVTKSVATSPKLEPTAALTRQQAATIVENLGKQFTQADQKKDAKLLKPIVDNPALRIRTQQYRLVEDEPFQMLSFKSQSFTPVTKLTWPRLLAVATTSSGQNAAAVLLLQQENARSNYKLMSFGRIFPGQNIELARTEVGAQQLDANADGYIVTPEEAVKRYATVVGVNAEAGKQQVATDVLMQSVNAETGELREAVGNKGVVTWQSMPGQVQGAIAGPNGDAFVFGTLKMVTQIKKTDADSRIRLSGPIATFLGDNAQIDKGIEYTREAMFVLRVPKKGSNEPIRAVAAEMAPVGAVVMP